MAIGERFRSGGAHGIARFLADHQGCNSGFDVRRDERGKLSITCEGCGASVSYQAAEAGDLATGGPELGGVPANGAAGAPLAPPPPEPPVSTTPAAPMSFGPPPSAPAPPTAAPAPVAPRPVAPPSVGRPTTARGAGAPAFPGVRGPQPKRRSGGKGGGVVPSWLSVALISALILGGLTMIAIGLTKEDNEQPPAAPPAGQAPAKGQKPAQKQGQAQTPAAPQEEPAVPEQGAAPALNRKNFARFSIGVPTGWRNGNEGEGVAITAPGSTAEIVVISQQGSFSQDQLAQGARGVLAERHQGAQIGSPKPVRIGAQKGLRVVATYPGGEEAAVVISARGFSHLIVQRVDRGASPDLSQQADAALASFKPR